MISIKDLNQEELAETSMVEIAYAVMKEHKSPFIYHDLLKQVAEIKSMSEEEVNRRISSLYTDLNIDGRFICVGENTWGLRSWYPVEKMEEDFTVVPKTRKKAKAKAADEFEEEEEFEDYEDEFEDLEDELDEITDEENQEEFEEDLDGFDDNEEESEDEDIEDEEEFEDEDDL
ncbi:DNA-directed RNA polymerase subunit delta [Alkalihalobacillus sp. LMS39]|uniref:DNA-directed RNA polymerase subunit delta n=1 Tax=Alkalihalobacillus sp. LMS39 TaxID=2924032 RepID=UPI001FB49393|nr:DNA-directed RNA polymerase subunit delta [Alkalihalobacillus sp. LMS39]UOE93977.1 DNA-directed RNA polymerase subunit delta [Alkalihalobacillus sp. LMS39]